MRPLSVRWLGRVEYGAALKLQKEAEDLCARTGEETLFLLEHSPVYTLGRNASRADILFTPDRCRELGIRIHEVDRGGKVTFHGHGQLVGYPILNLSPDRKDVKRYVTDLEEAIIATVAEFGVAGVRSPLRERVTSVWVGNDKLAAIGIHISRWITTHGFALNVSTDLGYFLGIVACGITDGGVTSMEKILKEKIPLELVAATFVRKFSGIFGRSPVTSFSRESLAAPA